MRALGYDMNSVEWAVRDGVPYAIDFMNPAPGHGHQLADARLLRLGGEAHGRHGDPAGARSRGRSAQDLRWATLFWSGSAGRSTRRQTASVATLAMSCRCTSTRSPRTTTCSTDDAGRRRRRRSSTTSSRRRGLFFGDRPLCTVLRPRFLTPAQYRLLQRARPACCCARSRKALRRAAMADPAFRDQFRLARLGGDARSRSIPASATPSPTSRLDAFFVAETASCSFTEYNAETPAGAGVHRRAHRGVPRPAGDARVPADATTCAPLPGAPRRAARAARRVRSSGRAARELPRDRDPRLARGADATASSCCSSDYFESHGPRVRHRRPARGASTATAS